MPSFVITEKCDGCAGQDKTACMYICPHDLMALKGVVDKETNEVKMKGVNQEPVQCWECYSCVKICPQQAIEIRCYADFAPLGGSVIPLPGSDSIMWTIKFRNGKEKKLQKGIYGVIFQIKLKKICFLIMKIDILFNGWKLKMIM